MRASLGALLLVSVCGPVQALERPPPVHGLWVWKSAAVLGAPQGPAELLRFCKSAGISEVYVSFPAHANAAEEGELAALIAPLHGSRLRAEALISRSASSQKWRDR